MAITYDLDDIKWILLCLLDGGHPKMMGNQKD
jgi:hypothetical protein